MNAAQNNEAQSGAGEENLDLSNLPVELHNPPKLDASKMSEHSLDFIYAAATLGLHQIELMDNGKLDAATARQRLQRLLTDIKRQFPESPESLAAATTTASAAAAAPDGVESLTCCSACETNYNNCIKTHTVAYCTNIYNNCIATCNPAC